MQTNYTKTFKIEAIKKVLSRSPGVSIRSIVDSLGIPQTTFHGWLKAMNDKNLTDIPTSGESVQKSPYQWTAEERFQAIIETASLSQEECAKYCREKGLFPHHLEAWKKEFVSDYKKANSIQNHAKVKALVQKTKKLEAELRRKEKALAEAAALLVLKKKADDYWGIKEDD